MNCVVTLPWFSFCLSVKCTIDLSDVFLYPYTRESTMFRHILIKLKENISNAIIFIMGIEQFMHSMCIRYTK